MQHTLNIVGQLMDQLNYSKYCHYEYKLGSADGGCQPTYLISSVLNNYLQGNRVTGRGTENTGPENARPK